MSPVLKTLFRVSPKLESLSLIARATLLQYLLWMRSLALGVMTIIVLFQYHKVEAGLIFAALLNIPAIYLAKQKSFEWGAYLIIVEQCIAIPIFSTLANATEGATSIAPIWLVLAPIIASLVLTVRDTAITVTFTFIGAAYIFLVRDPTHTNTLEMVLASVVMISLLALLSAFIRQRFEIALEQERAKLTHTSKLASMGEMAAGVAHELNSPLSAILVAAEMIEDEMANAVTSPKTVLESTKMIFEVAERMRKIISGLKTFSRDASNETKIEIEVKDWIHSTFNLCQERFHFEGISLSLSHLNLDQVCEVQSIQVSQVLLNLLTNSSEAVAGLTEKWIRVSVEAKNEWVEISVTDSGGGIAREAASKIFEPFFSTKDYGRGIGLGLSISHEIMQRHGGDLIYDAKCSNTRFIMRFPAQFNKIKTSSEAA